MTGYGDLCADETVDDPLAKMRGLLETFNEKNDELQRMTTLSELAPVEVTAAQGLVDALAALGGDVKAELRSLQDAGHEVALGQSLRNGHWFLRGPRRGSLRS